MNIPKIFPGLALFPKKDLPLDQSAVSINGGDFPHLFVRKPSGDNTGKIGAIVVDRKRNGSLAALNSPLDANDSRV